MCLISDVLDQRCADQPCAGAAMCLSIDVLIRLSWAVPQLGCTGLGLCLGLYRPRAVPRPVQALGCASGCASGCTGLGLYRPRAVLRALSSIGVCRAVADVQL